MCNEKGKTEKEELEVGDIITHVNQQKVNNIDEMVSKINSLKPKEITLTYKRNNKENKTTLKIIEEENVFKTGLYVKDSITGIGTLSFIDPETKIYGALGHEIIEKTTGKMLEVKNGKIFESNVTNIDRSENGNPGSKNADFDFDKINGNILENTESGIFGKYTADIPNKQKYKVPKFEEIKLGKAKTAQALYDDKKGFTSPNHRILSLINETMIRSEGRIIFNIFSNNICRIQELFDALSKTHRKIVIMGKTLQGTIKYLLDKK